MSKSTVSLLIPCYKCGETIVEVLDSAINQSDPFDEIICYVDGCPSDSLEIIEKYRKVKYPLLRVYASKKNRGVAYSRNRLRTLATCEFVSYQDSDDLLHPSYLEKMRPKTSLGHVTLCFFEQIELSGEKNIKGKQLTEHCCPITYLINNFYHLNSAIFCNTYLNKIQGLLETITLYEDKELLLRFALSGGGLILVPEALAYWVKRPSSLMHSIAWEKHNFCLLMMAKNLESYFLQQPLIVQQTWGRYLEQKLQMVYFMSRCTKYFDELLKYAARPEKKSHRILSSIVGYEKFLFLLYLYSRINATN